MNDTSWLNWPIQNRQPTLMEELDLGVFGKAIVIETRIRSIAVANSNGVPITEVFPTNATQVRLHFQINI